MLCYIGKSCTQLALVQITYKLRHFTTTCAHYLLSKCHIWCVMLPIGRQDKNVDN